MKLVDTAADPLLVRAITGVIRNAEEGELARFACTQGLPQLTLRTALRRCAPERLSADPLADEHYQVIMQSRPEAHAALVALLLAGRSPQAAPRHTEWLAYAIAAAATGSRQLWDDLGVDGREQVSALLHRYFEPLFLRNTGDLPWQCFLFAELAHMAGHADGHGPDCTRRAKPPACFSVSGGQRR